MAHFNHPPLLSPSCSEGALPCICPLIQRLRIQAGSINDYCFIKILQNFYSCLFETGLKQKCQAPVSKGCECSKKKKVCAQNLGAANLLMQGVDKKTWMVAHVGKPSIKTGAPISASFHKRENRSNGTAGEEAGEQLPEQKSKYTISGFLG